MRFPYSASVSFVVLTLLVAIGCGGGGGAGLTIPDSPDGTVRVVLDGLVEHQPEVVWRALPPSYQQDVLGLTRDFADTVDPAVFDRAVAVARKAVAVLQSKKEVILGAKALEQSQIDAETVDVVWETAVTTLNAVLASDITDLATLRELDIDAFLASTGSVLMDQASRLPAEYENMASFAQKVAAFEQAEVELKTEDGEHAVVVISAPGEDSFELPLVRVEDRWIPGELAARWPQAMAEARARIEHLKSEEAAQIRVQVLFGLGIVEGFVDQINVMETSDQIDDLIGGILGNIMAAQGGQKVTEG